MRKERKDAVFQIRLSTNLLHSFKNKCENSAPEVIPAEWLRDKIEEFVKEDEGE